MSFGISKPIRYTTSIKEGKHGLMSGKENKESLRDDRIVYFEDKKVEVNSLKAEFIVSEPPASCPTFEVTNLSISPAEVKVGETVTIGAWLARLVVVAVVTMLSSR